MKNKAVLKIIISQAVILSGFLIITIINEVYYFPHYLLKNSLTLASHKTAEIIIEVLVFLIFVLIEYLIINHLLKRIKILDGLIPICASCKKIREDEKWEQIEFYIKSHTMAKFTHSFCPECLIKLYPEFYYKSGKAVINCKERKGFIALN